MRKKFIATLFIIAAFSGMSYVSAIADTKKGCEKKGDSCTANLKLTKEQKTKVEDIQTECKKVKIQAAADIKIARIDLNSLLKKDTIDNAAVDAKVNEIGDLIKKSLKSKYECKVKILSVLDAEQKKVYLESSDDCSEGEHHDCGEKGGKMGCEKKGKKPSDTKGM
ncbi:MAG: Spy/CpxP family protein refolding chaperone [Deltaproteobacteria bacterium]|nr:Spy/CpxP family protein refolding chaperone [Deltaproteobacteria bacterium]